MSDLDWLREDSAEAYEYTLPVPHKVYMVAMGRGYVSPDRFDDLPELMRWAHGFWKDPWTPADRKPDLLRFYKEAEAVLDGLQSP